MKNLIRDLWEDESGVTSIEYGLIVGIMAAILVSVLGMFGGQLKDLFAAISDMLGEATDQVNQTTTTP